MFRHGLGVSEACALKLDQVDIESRVLHVSRLKKGLSTTHPLRTDELRVIKAWLAERAKMKPDGRAFFVSQHRKPLNRRTAWLTIRKYGELAGLPLPAHPHMLRHACGFALADQGADTRPTSPWWPCARSSSRWSTTACSTATPKGIEFLPIERFVKFVPPLNDIEAVLALAEPLDRAYLVTVWQLAARVREVNQLAWEDVDFQRRQVRLWTRKKKGGHKTPRWVDMSDRVFAALKYAQWQRLSDTYVFINPRFGKPWDYRDKFFDNLCKKAGVKEMGYHALRHQKASALADEGQSLVYIKEFLGHEDISTTSLYLQSLGIKK